MRDTLELEIRGENINLGLGWVSLVKGTSLFNRIENTLIAEGVAHNMTSIDSHDSGWDAAHLTVTYNRPVCR